MAPADEPTAVRTRLAALHPDAWAWSAACCAGDREQALDVLHDVYEKVLGGRAVFLGRSTFKTWLFGVIRMTARSHRRRALLTRALFCFLDGDGDRSEAPGPPEPPDAAAVRSAVAGLPQRQREIIELVFFHDLTVEEAALVQRVSVGAARQHYARAKEKLKAELGEKGLGAP